MLDFSACRGRVLASTVMLGLTLVTALASARPLRNEASLAARPAVEGTCLGEPRGCPSFVSAINRDVPALLEELSVPAASVAAIENGRLVLLKGYGRSDAKVTRRASARTLFSVQSVSKLVTALVVMSLVEDHHLSLDEPALKCIKRFHLPAQGHNPDKVTVRRLLSHTAGVNSFGYGGWLPGDKLPTLVEALRGRTNGGAPTVLSSEPGTRWDYSNGGYALLQLLVEEVTGKPFADAAEVRVLRPLRMTNSRFAVVDDIKGDLALSFDELGEPTPPPRLPELGASGLFTNAEDLSRLALFLMEAGPPPKRHIVSRATLGLMMTPVAESEGRQGLGFALLRGGNAMPDGIDRVGHDGRNRGWSSFFWVSPRNRDGLIVLTNSSLGWNVSNQLLAEWQNHKSGTVRPIRRSIGPAILSAYRLGGVTAAEQRFLELRKTRPDDFIFREEELNEMGYALLWKGRAKDAAGIFAINQRAYPTSWNAWDSLGDALKAAGNKVGARSAFTKSLQINPRNEHARKMLAQLV